MERDGSLTIPSGGLVSLKPDPPGIFSYVREKITCFSGFMLFVMEKIILENVSSQARQCRNTGEHTGTAPNSCGPRLAR